MSINTPVAFLARNFPELKGRTPSREMEEDWMADAQPADWRRQRAEDNFILDNQDVTPTTDMAMMIKVEELMSTEEKRDCQPYRRVRSACGQINWCICRHADSYGCYFKMNAVADLMTDDIKGETIVAMGDWRHISLWKQGSI
eukprot:14842389-Heterocapsa_arctica.AAC.2